MKEVEIILNDSKRGAFFIEEGGKRLAEMEIAISSSNLIVYHTEVQQDLRGNGVGVKLMDTMVAYARHNMLKVIPLCSFVRAQFQKYAGKYDTIWNRDWKGDGWEKVV